MAWVFMHPRDVLDDGRCTCPLCEKTTILIPAVNTVEGSTNFGRYYVLCSEP
ncbi:hypothetical protein CONPUDRAFT_158789 [Coniophora puteana RWD-64-598 SS2]|uniref:Uncharacterized protein n=1 Tax=Coniophora puteana (strain RWD-64-598) TaxID=741705 RepID=A0A5M3M9P9_CONPW|nr:uncharacterized protein CONPUDRAFT_158789 [Coniophora puteana RWD-64-598 SS2]EIW76012.1 hypothetical protein CONPUDRAFT_158789 [Coniophora puteana RWD-64-598 SS2]